jgi:hypothetical protein
MTDVNKARIKALMQLQRWSGLSLVDAATPRRQMRQRDVFDEGDTLAGAEVEELFCDMLMPVQRVGSEVLTALVCEKEFNSLRDSLRSGG